MEMTQAIPVKNIPASRLQEVELDKLEFGKYVSDHMMVCDYKNGKWQQPEIMPFADINLSPAALGLHYGQTVFEGMKAFRTSTGEINIFRIGKHYERFERSLDRMCMAVPPREIFFNGLKQLVALDRNWVPGERGSALYIRPFVFASEARFGVKIADEYKFIIITGPVPALYTHPIKVKVETHFARAVKGGTGYAKCGGNYGASYLPTKLAKEEGYDQVLWTDGVHHEFIEESGTMNVMFVFDGELVTPPLSDSILDGVTRDSLLEIARGLGIKTVERTVSLSDLRAAFKSGTITEAFGAGTAAIISPIALIGIEGTDYPLPAYNDQSIMNRLKKELDDMRYGTADDLYAWNSLV